MFSIFPIDDIADFLQDAIKKVFNIFIKPIEGIINDIEKVVNTLEDAAESIVEFFGDVGGAIVDGAEAVGGAVVDGAEAVGGAVVDGAEAVGGAVVDGAEAVGGAVADGAEAAVGAIGDAIGSIFGRAKRANENVPGRILADFVYDMSCSNFSRYRNQRKKDNHTRRMSCPRVDFGQCQNAIFNLIPSPSKLTSPIFDILMIPFKESFKIYDETLRSAQDTFKPACKAMIQYSLDVQFEKLLDYEFGNLPGFAFLPVTKFKIRTFYERLLNILDFYSDSLPGMKKFADDVNVDVTKVWRENEDNLNNIFVTFHTYISGTNMIEDNIERLRRKLEKKKKVFHKD